MSDRPTYSVVIPSYDEEPNIRPLAERLAATFEKMGVSDWEVLFVENGSSDGSLSLLEDLHSADSRIKYLSLSRNFGHSGAVCCGLDHARGEFVVLMDGDQQDPPEMIEAMAAKASEDDLEVVYAVRRSRKKESWLKRLAMKVFYRVWRKTAYIHVPLDAGNFCLMANSVVGAIASMRERGRFVPGIRAFVGFRQGGLSFDRPPRGGGEAKTNFRVLSGIAIDGLLAFSVYPLRFMLLFGSLAMLTSLVVGVVVLSMRALAAFSSYEMPDRFLGVQVLLLLFAGATMLGLGVIGEYLGRIYQETKRRPIYIVRESAGVAEPKLGL